MTNPDKRIPSLREIISKRYDISPLVPKVDTVPGLESDTPKSAEKHALEAYFLPEIIDSYLSLASASPSGCYLGGQNGLLDIVPEAYNLSLPKRGMARWLYSCSEVLFREVLRRWEARYEEILREQPWSQLPQARAYRRLEDIALTRPYMGNTPKKPALLFRNGITNGNKAMWYFLDVVAQSCADSGETDFQGIAQRSYVSLAEIGLLTNDLASSLTLFLLRNSHRYYQDESFDINDWQIMGQGKRKRIELTQEAWNEFWFHDGIFDYIISESHNGCPLFQAGKGS